MPWESASKVASHWRLPRPISPKNLAFAAATAACTATAESRAPSSASNAPVRWSVTTSAPVVTPCASRGAAAALGALTSPNTRHGPAGARRTSSRAIASSARPPEEDAIRRPRWSARRPDAPITSNPDPIVRRQQQGGALGLQQPLGGPRRLSRHLGEVERGGEDVGQLAQGGEPRGSPFRRRFRPRTGACEAGEQAAEGRHAGQGCAAARASTRARSFSSTRRMDSHAIDCRSS